MKVYTTDEISYEITEHDVPDQLAATGPSEPVVTLIDQSRSGKMEGESVADIDEIMHPNDQHRLGITSEQVAAAFGIVLAIGDTIQQLGSVPSGELYVHLMGQLSLNQYDAVIAKLIQCGLVRKSNHLLTWIGPPKKEGN